MTSVRTTSTRYDHQAIEAKWRERWEKDGIYHVDDDDSRPNWYELHMYPYPSGDLHIGHWYAMSGADLHARFKRMSGFNVLHPMGFDAFGLNAENAAIQRGIHPFKWTMSNIENMRLQLRSMGPMYDWDREIITCTPDYYKWNQWFFLQFYKKGLAYRGFAPVNWCPSCKTVLANEQVIDGMCERSDTPVEQRDMNQWFFKITDYAEELLDQSKIDWPERINTMQTNWVGRSEGVEVEFDISEYGLEQKTLRTFTTRIDTVFGVTFVVLAPEHPLVPELTIKEHKAEVADYIHQASLETEIERLSTEKEKTGVFTGAYCINRLNGERVPILTADYVLHTYGTGVVMGVPAHDARDFVFAKKYGLPIRVVVAPPDWDGGDLEDAYLAEGTQVNSGEFDGLSSSEGLQKIADHIEAQGWGERKVNYRMRDWLVSRQRYWGTPIPIIYCPECGEVPVPDDELPVVLPEDAEFLPTGESPLALHEGFVNVPCPDCGRPSKRETDTMDTFVDSSWYFLRYASAGFQDGPFDPEAIKKWNPVDQYTGGVEHAVMHLLYARFFTKALRDLGLIDFDEPFVRLFNQGTIIYQHQKMSKSRGNVIAPDDYVSEVGADVVRSYLMFLGPWEAGGDWSDSGINGVARWANRVWEVANRDSSELDHSPVNENSVRDVQRALHKTIKKVSDDMDSFKFNTAIASLMELTNTLTQAWERSDLTSDAWNEAVSNLVAMMAPITPYLSEELWEATGHESSVHTQSWPEWDESLAADETITLVVQVNGRLRDRIEVPVGIEEDTAKETALSSPKIQPHIEGKDVSKVIYVPGRLVNIVAG
ncbi:MAG: leucine--tRNA ligase [SAR202 cluster bacterium]|jgi:leucyl-tRNA synthetase|nr:leucine--tRNA ligase [SAR202 cluster bacterium]